MERIGDILKRSIPQADSSRREASEAAETGLNRVKTEEEARQRGLLIEKRQPPDEVCEYCGTVLHHEGLVLMGKVFIWNQEADRCTCPEAVKKWQNYEAEQERKRIEAEQAEQRAAMQRRIDRILGKSGIKKRFRQRTFENFKADTPERKRAYRTAKDYADNFDLHSANGTGLYIEGTNGTGKTHLAAAIAMQLMTQHGIPCICKTANDLLLDIRNTFDSSEGVTEASVLGVYKKVELLIIDDLGKEQCSDWSMSTLYSILNDRYEEMRPTIVTTNYNSDDLARALTPKGGDNLKIVAIISRLREVSQVMTMAWEDYRSGR